MCMQALLQVTYIVQLCFSIQVTIACNAALSPKVTRFYCSEIWVFKHISELECHSQKKKASQCFDQHRWKDDKTTFNSFEFRLWLINWHKNYVLEWKFNHFSVNCSLLQKWEIIGFDVARQCCCCRWSCAHSSENAATVSENDSKLYSRNEKSSYKRRTKSSGETRARLKRCFHFTPRWLWREIR